MPKDILQVGPLQRGWITPPFIHGKAKDPFELSDTQIGSLLNNYSTILNGAGFQFFEGNLDAAKTCFVTGLTDFLAIRVASARGLFSAFPNASSTGKGYVGSKTFAGLKIRVISQRSGLQILAGHAFFPELYHAFGNSLSTPVDGYLNPGIYIFGGQSKRFPRTFENTPFSIPPTTTIHLQRV